MSDKPTILIIEDSAPQARLYQEYLKDGLRQVFVATNGQDAKDFIKKTPPDLILLDFKLPDMDGNDILYWLNEQNIACLVIVITAHSSVDIAVDMMQNGADDFLEKPLSANRLKTSVKNLLQQAKLQHLVNDYQNTFKRDTYHGFIGSCLPMQAVYRIIDAAAPSKATIFITGESGTGKEICAQAIHLQGHRAKNPFIPVNCAAIPLDLMESELFGHVKGAFTGAVSERKGLASQADGGTLFLDEIGEMDLELQKKLLRFVQTGTFQKVGGSKLETVDARIICATNRDPLQDVATGKFREDLYYRLHVVPLHLPPLRDRTHDILSIARHFLALFAKEEGKSFNSFSAEVEAVMSHYAWPGNVRQLQNVVQNIVVLNKDTKVKLAHLPPPLNAILTTSIAAPMASSLPDQGVTQGVTQVVNNAAAQADSALSIIPLAVVEKDTIERAISLCQGNIPKAAALLDVSPSTIYRKKQSWETPE